MKKANIKIKVIYFLRVNSVEGKIYFSDTITLSMAGLVPLVTLVIMVIHYGLIQVLLKLGRSFSLNAVCSMFLEPTFCNRKYWKLN